MVTKKELIDYCKLKDSEICNFCKYFNECDVFIQMTGHIPLTAPQSEYTDEVVE